MSDKARAKVDIGEGTWYLLFDGSSPDGRGNPNYIGRTTDKKKAVAHYKKCKSPYSTGKVIIVTDDRHTQMDQSFK